MRWRSRRFGPKMDTKLEYPTDNFQRFRNSLEPRFSSNTILFRTSITPENAETFLFFHKTIKIVFCLIENEFFNYLVDDALNLCNYAQTVSYCVNIIVQQITFSRENLSLV